MSQICGAFYLIMVRLGRVKNYLRYGYESSFGLVSATQAGAPIRFLQMRETRDRYLAVPASDSVYFWDLKTKQVINKLTYDESNAAEVTTLECFYGGHPRTNLIAVGYANGRIRVFEYETGLLKVTFTGHRSAVTSLAFDRDGSRVASGGKDTNIALWDLLSERGLFSLRGHKNAISKLAFLYNQHYQRCVLISSSSDAVSTIKFWDLNVQHCFYTVPGQSNGVWSFVLLKDGTRMVTGTSAPELRVYSIEFTNGKDEDTNPLFGVAQDNIEYENDNESEAIPKSETEYGLKVRHMGNILRNSTSIASRVQDIVYDEEESLMICYSVDKNIELYKLRSKTDALTYARKQAKKAARKSAKRKKDEDPEVDQSQELDAIKTIEPSSIRSLEDLDPQTIVKCEFNTKIAPRHLGHKVKALIFLKTPGANDHKRYKIVVMAASNRLDTYILEPDAVTADSGFRHVSSIESYGHRTDVRSLAISADNRIIMSASGESMKIWNVETLNCTATIDLDYAQCCIFANAHNLDGGYENRFALVGTRSGQLQVVDLSSAQVIEIMKVSEDDKPITAICNLPDRSGVITGSEDQTMKIFNYVWDNYEEDGQTRVKLKLEEDRQMKFQEGITSIKVSANQKLVAIALLDSTVRVHFLDTLKYFLTMYGHKFPVTTMDISDDSTLIATGSADKNIKIWGLDFGDCHKSIFAHDDIVSCVKFVPKTHHLFSCSRDKSIKQWDCDIFIKIQALRKHQAEVWCMDVSSNGKYLITGSHDRSMRLYRKTEEIIVPAEEEEAEHEEEDERNVYEKQENIVPGDVNKESGVASKMTADVVSSVDRLIEAIGVFIAEELKERDYLEQCILAESKGEAKPQKPDHDPLLMTAMTTDYNRFMLETIRRLRSSDLEQVLLFLPFDFVQKLLNIVAKFLERRWDVERMVMIAIFLLKVNYGQIAASPIMMPLVHRLRKTILERAAQLRDYSGFNLVAMEHLASDKKYLTTKSKDRIL